MASSPPGRLTVTLRPVRLSRAAATAALISAALASERGQNVTRYGASGAALGWAIVNTPVAIWVALLCRKRCGVDPSALAILPGLRTLTQAVRAPSALRL